MAAKKDVKSLLDKVSARGFRVEDRGNKYRVFGPGGFRVVSKTASDVNAVRNILTDLRQIGICL